MSAAKAFEYVKTLSIEDALEALRRYGADGRLFAGGTDLLVQMRQNAVHPGCLIEIKHIPHLGDICEDSEYLTIGAAATLRDVERYCVSRSVFPALAESARRVGAIQLRNRATVGGNLLQSIKCPYYNQSHINTFMNEALEPCFRRGGKACYAVKRGREVSHAILVDRVLCRAPFGSNIAIALAASGGSVVLCGKSGLREEPIENFYEQDGKPKIGSDELITKIRIPLESQRSTSFFHYKAHPAGYTLLHVAVALTLEDDGETCRNASVWLGGVAPSPYEAKEIENYLNDNGLTEEVIDKAGRLLFHATDVNEPTMRFKVAKARMLCRQALSSAWGGN